MRNDEAMLGPRLVLAIVAVICFTTAGCGLLDGVGVDGTVPAYCKPREGVQAVLTTSQLQQCDADPQKMARPPSLAEGNEIISKIESFGPTRNIDIRHFDAATFSVCVSLRANANPAEIAPAAAKWFRYNHEDLTLAQSRSVVDLIEGQDWCGN